MNNSYLEKPFEFLRRKNGEKYSEETIKNWYRARAYVLEKLKDVAFRPYDADHLEVVVKSDSPLMLSVVRQVALSAHYINYDETNENELKRRRSKIKIVTKSSNILVELKKEEYLYNLLNYCKWIGDGVVNNQNSFIDIEIEIVPEWNNIGSVDKTIIMDENELLTFCNHSKPSDIFQIDTRAAQYADRIYALGVLDKYPFEEIYSAKRFELALDVFHYYKLQDPVSTLFHNGTELNQIKVKNLLSNIFCADCFKSREKSVMLCKADGNKKKKDLWAECFESLCKSEHARWVVEKLIMGFRPYSTQERLMDESLFYDRRRRMQYRAGLKNNIVDPIHIDICSNNDLRRKSPFDMKYDGFLMLGVPFILDKIRKDDARKG